MIPAVGQVWNDTERKYRPARQIRILSFELRGIWRYARIEARQGDRPWHFVPRPLRVDRIRKRFKFNEEATCDGKAS